MKIKSVIVIEVEADDFVAAGDHQAAIRRLFEPIMATYPQANLTFSQVKQRAASQVRPSLRLASNTGNMHHYDS
ncbi:MULTISPECIES: hypothetical protein [Nitrospirillum]|jgi:hypothetical protein|uniref:Uncharacterized protein n=2 Tax=Nitrospirillum TaxID=1543705 RepID=A0A248JU51_9PROT|nr:MULTISPECIES: hypothetical protein [Nitrospirillum]ASG22040.1 hypothetical protein Y958_13685 [Nitrospirillum amazonense CBAmc]MDG3444489.1 hypothetical protein [Nitrospirillum amazonense]MEA1653095.1 hypothetical protein [Nitrospirillum sp. BR 11164]MEC4592500.1 hypothetical protein [Nitrospirillum amazonense]TWB11584.1 hypothetical protein FBZ89_12912 [Nitrospirillum amazonense]